MTKYNKPALYFFLAVLPSLTQPTNPPADAWEWFKYGAMALYQGLLALKAFQSTEDKGEAGQPGEPPLNVAVEPSSEVQQSIARIEELARGE